MGKVCYCMYCYYSSYKLLVNFVCNFRQLKEAKQKYVVLKKNQQQQQAEKISSGSGSASNGEVQVCDVFHPPIMVT